MGSYRVGVLCLRGQLADCDTSTQALVQSLVDGAHASGRNSTYQAIAARKHHRSPDSSRCSMLARLALLSRPSVGVATQYDFGHFIVGAESRRGCGAPVRAETARVIPPVSTTVPLGRVSPRSAIWTTSHPSAVRGLPIAASLSRRPILHRLLPAAPRSLPDRSTATPYQACLARGGYDQGALHSHRAGRATPVGTIGGHTLTAHTWEI